MGVDPGLANTGLGIINAEGQTLTAVHYDCITTESTAEFPDRLLRIHEALTIAIDTHRPDVCAMESIFFAKNAKSAFQVGHGRGACILTAALRGVPVFEYTPLQIKKALVGVGRAEKAQVQYMTRMLLGLRETPQPEHAADALAVAICHANSMKFRTVIGTSALVYGKGGKQ